MPWNEMQEFRSVIQVTTVTCDDVTVQHFVISFFTLSKKTSAEYISVGFERFENEKEAFSPRQELAPAVEGEADVTSLPVAHWSGT